jgi:hypothetical protein
MQDGPHATDDLSLPRGEVSVFGPQERIEGLKERQGPRTAYRADAAFLAHLVAARTQAPAQRAKRRAAPETGAAAYRTGLGLLAAAPVGRVAREA